MDLGYLEDGLWKAGGLCNMGMYVPTAQFEKFGLYLASLFFLVLMTLTAGHFSHLESMVFLSGCFDAVLSARVQLTVHFQSGKSKCRKAYTVSRLS